MKELNKIDYLYLELERNYRERTEYSRILGDMDSVIKENVYVYFKMFIHNTDVGWEEVKHSEQSYEIPHELNEQIYHLVHNYFFKKTKELEQKRDKIMSQWLEQNNMR